MARQEKKLAQKRGRPATGAGKTVGVRFQPDELASIDAYLAAGGATTRPQAIRVIVADWLRTHGFGSDELRTSGPATDVVKAMDEAIEKHRKSKGERKR